MVIFLCTKDGLNRRPHQLPGRSPIQALDRPLIALHWGLVLGISLPRSHSHSMPGWSVLVPASSLVSLDRSSWACFGHISTASWALLDSARILEVRTVGIGAGGISSRHPILYISVVIFFRYGGWTKPASSSAPRQESQYKPSIGP